MMWHGIPNGCGLWLPEDKKLICGMKGENVVAYGHLHFFNCLKEFKRKVESLKICPRFSSCNFFWQHLNSILNTRKYQRIFFLSLLYP